MCKLTVQYNTHVSRELAHTPPVVIASYCLLANFLAIHHVDNLLQLMKCTSSQANVMSGIFKFHPVDFLPRVMRGIPCALPSEEHCTPVHTYTLTSLGDTVALVWLCLGVPHIAPTVEVMHAVTQ